MIAPLPIGISDFKLLIEGGYAYVDKTLFIQELIEIGAQVTLIPRLRRFGKTLNLSMLRYFFEKSPNATSHLFSSLNIWKEPKYRQLQGKYPVIFLSLKDVKCLSWEETFEKFRQIIASEFERHRYLLEGDFLSPTEKKSFQLILEVNGNKALYECSLNLLTKWLHRYYNKRAILLIDEYDTPAHSAYLGGFYDTLISFLRNWLSAGLKDNSCLERGVLTGILRIAKESVFSGLNNLKSVTILNESFQDKFGFLESEVKILLEKYQLANKLPEIREWYNGYRIGSCGGIYNPWSVLTCISEGGRLYPYWVNTSDNGLMKQLITKGGEDLKSEIEVLLRDGIVEKTIEDGIIFTSLDNSPAAVWSLLLFSGYVTLASTPVYGKPCQLRIPNVEVGELYKSMVLECLKKVFIFPNIVCYWTV
ncbi:MAG: AAA family ATPase [Candidatus Protochlamydia sp.]|nr:AAA family ATPase [Candidatus Protochlamydia sp.]